MNKYFNYSLILHFSLFTFMVGGYFFGTRGYRIEDDNTLVVNFTAIDKVSKAPEIGPMPKVEIEEKKKDKKEEEETFGLPDPTPKEKPKIVETKAEDKPKPKPKPRPKPKDTPKAVSNKPKTKLTTANPSKKINNKPIKLATLGQRADQFGLVVTASEGSMIVQKIKSYWNPPEIAENSGVKITVVLNIDKSSGRIIAHKIVERKGPATLHKMFEDRILYVVKNPNINFLDLQEKTLDMIAKKGLEVVFDAETGDY